jgi:hydrogenase 3 maturation protease
MNWQIAFRQTLAGLQTENNPLRIAVLGIGHELCGDDAAGIMLARELKAKADISECLLALETGPAPENFTGTVRRFEPDLVLLVDAAQMNAAPGEVRWLDWKNLGGISASTHTMPLDIIVAYLTAELGCQAGFLGIQPVGNLVGAPLSPEVQKAIENTAQSLMEMLTEIPQMDFVISK